MPTQLVTYDGSRNACGDTNGAGAVRITQMNANKLAPPPNAISASHGERRPSCGIAVSALSSNSAASVSVPAPRHSSGCRRGTSPGR